MACCCASAWSCTKYDIANQVLCYEVSNLPAISDAIL
ncbi:hypothetical protein TIFTF001_001667 [Ficus carica]|uniref:Uncharacterized protein n=1 Tax=Ficus carica TaxID=3494 RepID=A0AA87Z0F3_FICCA|nr:hypothetical protein TIFTF001_001667 [Ficus carica]